MLYKYVCVIGLVNTSKYMPVFIFFAFGIINFFTRGNKRNGCTNPRWVLTQSGQPLGVTIWAGWHAHSVTPLAGKLASQYVKRQKSWGSDSLSGLCCLRHVASL
jgi:hypothetical protein